MEHVLDNIALNIFNKYSIIRDDIPYKIAELEIYYFDENDQNKQDIFCHRNIEQKTLNQIYFHYSGFDITYGNLKNIFCGILIRGIEDEKGNFIYGPGKIAYIYPVKIKRKISLEFTGNNNYSFDNDEFTKKIFKLPRINLSRNIINQNYKNNFNTLKYYYNLKSRYIRLPNKNIFSIKEMIPDNARSITDLIW